MIARSPPPTLHVLIAAPLLAVALLAPPLAAAQSVFDQFRRSAEQELRRQADRAEQDARRKAEQEVRRKAEEALRNPPRTPPSPGAPAAPAVAPAQPASAPVVAPTVPTPPVSAPMDAAMPAAVRNPPTLAWATDIGFRDWGALLQVGDLVIGGNSSGGGGLFAVDVRTGKLRWRVPVRITTSAAPVTDGRHAIVAWGREALLAAYDLANGRQAWSKPMAAGQPTLADGTLFVQHRDGFLYALDPATGAERGKAQYARKENWCAAERPVVADGVVYVSSGLQPPSDGYRDFFVHAFDARTGGELWRYVPLSEYPKNYGACITEIVVVGDTVVAAGKEYVYGIDRATGRERWVVDVRDGERRAQLRGLVTVGGYLYGVTEGSFRAIDPANGQTLWSLPGRYPYPANAVADGVVYFQGRLQGAHDALPEKRGILNALDVATGRLLWSYAYPSEVEWSFDRPVVADGTLYVGHYKAVLKLQ